MYGYYYPFYRSSYIPPFYPGPAYGPYYNSSLNAFNSQIANQRIVNTGIATDVNQIFSPVQVY